MRKPVLALLLACVLVTPAHAALEQAWRALSPSVPAESLGVRLRAMELRPVAGVSPGAAAFALAQLHYARGEYRQAADAFLRASGRLTGEERGEARYWSRLTALALRGRKPRAPFAERAPSRARSRSWASRRPGTPSSAPIAPTTCCACCSRATPGRRPHPRSTASRSSPNGCITRTKPRVRVRLRAKLRHDQGPRATAPPPSPAAGTEPSGEVAIQIGAFGDEARARTLAESARRAGFADASVLRRPTPDGRATLHVVRLGRYPNREEARKAGERVQRALGVGWQVEKP
ncbi:MAG: SPOR domain-containing protein [Candidatus Eisenbacteria bacterium]|nr:SPOR domain-containing protein [Candidatus Eisenbacteria bacterium]